MREKVERVRSTSPRVFGDRTKDELATPILAILESAAALGEWDLSEQALAHLSARVDEPFFSVLVHTLLQAAEKLDEDTREAIGLDRLEARASNKLEELVAKPPGAPDDWSITPPAGCTCELCDTLAEFLAAGDVQKLEWPIAKAKRQHIHQRIDAHGLPVRHVTRRQGSPHTLVLSKTRELFEFEASQRQRWQASLDWLRQSGLT